MYQKQQYVDIQQKYANPIRPIKCEGCYSHRGQLILTFLPPQLVSNQLSTSSHSTAPETPQMGQPEAVLQLVHHAQMSPQVVLNRFICPHPDASFYPKYELDKTKNFGLLHTHIYANESNITVDIAVSNGGNQCDTH
jgi:hypothetical protein